MQVESFKLKYPNICIKQNKCLCIHNKEQASHTHNMPHYLMWKLQPYQPGTSSWISARSGIAVGKHSVSKLGFAAGKPLWKHRLLQHCSKTKCSTVWGSRLLAGHFNLSSYLPTTFLKGGVTNDVMWKNTMPSNTFGWKKYNDTGHFLHHWQNKSCHHWGQSQCRYWDDPTWTVSSKMTAIAPTEPELS